MSRPADWTPLATADPVPGDPGEVAQLGRRLQQVADQISADVSWLRSLCTARFWDCGAGQAFQGQVDDAADRLARAHERYLAAGEALGSDTGGPGYAGALEAAQSLSLRALTQARQAWSAMLIHGLPRLDSAGNPVPMVTPPKAGPQLSAAISRYNASALEYRIANGWLAEAIALRDEAAARATARIQAAIGADGMQDPDWARSTRGHDQTQCG